MGVLLVIIAAEEMPAGARAFAVSVLAMTAAVGAGGVVLFLQVAEATSWRVFYAVPLLFLLGLPHLSRNLPESKRFEVLEAHELHIDEPTGGSAHSLQSLDDRVADEATSNAADATQVATMDARDEHLPSDSRLRRFVTLGITSFMFAIFFTPASFYMNDWLRDEQGFVGWQISVLQVVTNLPGGIAIVVGGRLADKRGRRLIGALGVAGGVGFTVLMYLSTGWPIWLFSTVATLFGAMSVPALGVYGPELFGTSNRGVANGGLTLLGVCGSVIGLLTAGYLADSARWDTYATPMALLALAPALVVVVVLVFYPETAHRELEELNPEDAPPPRTAEELAHLEHELEEYHEHERELSDHHDERDRRPK
jgi:MFS family permease